MRHTMALLLAVFFVCSAPLLGEEARSRTVRIQLDLCCPESTEFEAFTQALPQNSEEQRSYEEFTQQMMAGMESLSALVQSGNIYSASCSIGMDDEIN